MKNVAQCEYFANFFCCVVLFDVYYVAIIMFGWKLSYESNFIAIFLTLANFPAFLDHIKGYADVSKNDG